MSDLYEVYPVQSTISSLDQENARQTHLQILEHEDRAHPQKI